MPRPLDHSANQATFIAASPENVYATITSADAWNTFFTTGMELDPRPGGKFIWRWKDWGPDFYNVEVPAEVLAAEPPSRFVFAWGSKHRSTVEFNLTAQFGGTVVRLKEHGYLDTPAQRDSLIDCAAGWGEAITLLKFYIEHALVYTPPSKEK